jgi:hypothetical protein
LSKSSEALLLLILLNYWKTWEAQTYDPQQQSEESSTMLGLVSSISTMSIMHYTRNINSSTKDGWSTDGIRHFEELMMKVEEDQNSKHGIEFEMRFQQLMKDHQTD